MGQSAPQAPTALVDRCDFTEENYQLLRQALQVEDSADEQVNLQIFLSKFRMELRPLVHPLFARLARGTLGETVAPWPGFIAGLSDLQSTGLDWSALLKAWSPGHADDPTGSINDTELLVELATSMCFWCVQPKCCCTEPAASTAEPADTSEDAALALESALGALKALSANTGPQNSNASIDALASRLESTVPCLPKAVTPSLLAALMHQPIIRIETSPIDSRVLDTGLRFLLRGTDSRLADSEAWTPLYRDWSDGRSFNGLLKGVLHYDGLAVVVLKTDEGNLIGGVAGTWSDGNGRFSGGPECFLFSLAPNLQVLRSSRRGGNYFYLNANAKNGKPRGIGFGGQEGFFRLWLDADLEECYVLESDATFDAGALLPTRGLQTKFNVARLEIWGCGGADADAAQRDQREKNATQRDLARKVDRARLVENEFDREMLLGGTFKATKDCREEFERVHES